MKGKDEVKLSKEELAQLKGGEEVTGNLPELEPVTPPGFTFLFDKNKNSAFDCKCDNRPVAVRNINKEVGCTCYCTPG